MIISLMIALSLVFSLISYFSGLVSPRLPRAAGVAGSGLILLLALYSYYLVLGSGGTLVLEEKVSWVPGLASYHVGIDGLSAPLVVLTAALVFLAALTSHIEVKEKEREYYSLLLLFEAVGIGVFVALDLVLFYFFWEITLIPMFFFIGVWGGPRRKYAAMKFLLYTFAGSLMMLLAFIGLYILGPAKTFDYIELLSLKDKLPIWLQLLASVGLLIGFGVKLPMFPFHTWLPDAHVAAPSPISVILAGVLLKMGGYGFIRFNLQLLTDAAMLLSWVYVAFGVITMFYGAIVAFLKDDFKRMVALTSINHMGYVLLGAFAGLAAAGLGKPDAAIMGIGGAVFQMFNHGFAIGLMFMLAGVLKHYVGSRDISKVRGLRLSSPRIAALLMVGSMAAMGVPPYSSFLSEFMVILSGIAFQPVLWVAVLVPGITASYYLWALRRMVFSSITPEGGARMRDLDNPELIFLILFLVPLVFLLFFNGLILDPLETFVSLLGV